MTTILRNVIARHQCSSSLLLPQPLHYRHRYRHTCICVQYKADECSYHQCLLLSMTIMTSKKKMLSLLIRLLCHNMSGRSSSHSLEAFPGKAVKRQMNSRARVLLWESSRCGGFELVVVTLSSSIHIIFNICYVVCRVCC